MIEGFAGLMASATRRSPLSGPILIGIMVIGIMVQWSPLSVER